ncbi:GyrI-like domain-containing protein [Maribacter aestuarii]|uniref:GyrI-like domain-containing protein n=1 Tax=Maribacter aestuarii TaxID=1130723 RepID=UPI00248AD468|nr:GyrI-like domain-containing protein [Maribacter aestuarii]
MKGKTIFLGILGLILVAMIGAFAYYGGFTKISPEIIQCGGETLVYEKMTGDYAQSAIVSDRVYQNLIDDHGIETTKGFGIYYDNPKTKEKSTLRSDVGCILETDFDKLDAIRADFEVSEYPLGEYLVAEFPNRGMSSVILGIIKVYPALERYVEENGYESDTPVMEIWDVPNKKITYRKQLIKRG